tara:strand:+ start:77 stop:1414 length:1338 start_codon:yes stop_codon:yes gene_type:complete
MKIFYNNSFSYSTFFLIFFLASCGDDHSGDSSSSLGHDSGSHSPKSQENLLTMLEDIDPPYGETSVHETAQPADGTASSSAKDLEALLAGDSPVTAEPAQGAKHSDLAQLIDSSPSSFQSEVTEGLYHAKDKEHENLLSELNTSKTAFEEQIKGMNSLVEQRDNTIRSLKLINQKLRDELNRLRKTNPETTASMPINGEIQVLRDELLRLKNTFTLKVKELDELRLYNKELLGRLDSLDPTTKRSFQGTPSGNSVVATSNNTEIPADNLEQFLPELSVVASGNNSGKVSNRQLSTGSLDFDAVVTAANGKIKEAFYTEFFIAKSNLREILENVGINLDNPKYKNISSHAELWAQSRKYPFRYPDLQKNIRKALLDSIDDEKSLGRRIRTDIDGNSGEISDLATGSYYIIGTASLGQVGVTWSVPVKVKSGRNKVSLTLANASWSL